jgi:hypothetical protein
MSTEPAWVHGEQGERSAQIIQVESGKYAAVVAVCGAICGLSLAVSLWAGYQAQLLTTEYRVAINHSMEVEARLNQLENENAQHR